MIRATFILQRALRHLPEWPSPRDAGLLRLPTPAGPRRGLNRGTLGCLRAGNNLPRVTCKQRGRGITLRGFRSPARAPERVRMTMRRIAVVLGLFLTVGVSSVAHAQRGDSGAIVGFVFDQTGAPIKGVRVTIASPTQIGGTRHAYS